MYTTTNANLVFSRNPVWTQHPSPKYRLGELVKIIVREALDSLVLNVFQVTVRQALEEEVPVINCQSCQSERSA